MLSDIYFISSISLLEHCCPKLIPLILHVKINLSTFQENNSSLATISGNCCHHYFTLIEELKKGGGDPQFSFIGFTKTHSSKDSFLLQSKRFHYLNTQRIGGKKEKQNSSWHHCNYYNQLFHIGKTCCPPYPTAIKKCAVWNTMTNPTFIANWLEHLSNRKEH